MDGSAVQPSWIPFDSVATAEDQIEFKLTLMTGSLPLHPGLSVDLLAILYPVCFFFLFFHTHSLKRIKP